MKYLNPLKRFIDWLVRHSVFRRRGAEFSVLLDRNRIFILPTRFGLLFSLTLLLMLVGSINYTLSLGYALTFLLGSMAAVSILHAYRNMAGIEVTPGRVEPVFAGQAARFPVRLAETRGLPRYAIGLQQGAAPPPFANLPAGTSAELTITLEAPKRGLLRPGRFSLFTRFPLGLFHAWSRVELDTSCLVYPRPDLSAPPLPMLSGGEGGSLPGEFNEDFFGLRAYQPGDPLRHVDWKAMARGQGMLTKQFAGQARAELWLDWEALAGMDMEARLSRLTRWALDAHAASRTFGLRLPGIAVPPASGETHLRNCLRELALFGIGKAAP